MKTQKHRLLALSACALAFCLLASGCRTSRLESSTLSLEKETDSTAAAEKTGSAESGDALTVPQLEGMLLSEASVTLEQAGLQAEYRFSAELAAAMEAAGLTALPAEDAFDDRDDNDMDDDDDDIDDVDDDVDDEVVVVTMMMSRMEVVVTMLLLLMIMVVVVMMKANN